MMKRVATYGWWLIAFWVLFLPSLSFAITAEEVMGKVIENLKGPPGRSVVGEGRLLFSGRDLQVRIARYCLDGREGFQVDFLSMVEDQETGGDPMGDKKYRVVREGLEISALTYLPSLRRGRKINYVPLDGILGSEYRFYFLPTVTNLHLDFSYSYAAEGDTRSLVGMRKPDSSSPFPRITLYLEKRGGASYVVEKAIYERGQQGESIVQLLEDYEEFTPGYWAPQRVVTGGTTLFFSHWKTGEPLPWLLSVNHILIGEQNIPRP